jgi:hypothetical protein
MGGETLYPKIIGRWVLPFFYQQVWFSDVQGHESPQKRRKGKMERACRAKIALLLRFASQKKRYAHWS